VSAKASADSPALLPNLVLGGSTMPAIAPAPGSLAPRGEQALPLNQR